MSDSAVVHLRSEQSLAWESFEQGYFWQLLQAEVLGSSTKLQEFESILPSVLSRVDPESMPLSFGFISLLSFDTGDFEAMLGLLTILRLVTPTTTKMALLLNLRAPFVDFVSATLSHWMHFAPNTSISVFIEALYATYECDLSGPISVCY